MASQAIGSLFVALGLDTAAFSAGVKQAQGKIEAFAGNLSRRLGALGAVPGIGQLQAGLAAVGVSAGAALGAGAAAAAVGLSALSVNAMHAAGEIKNLSSLANATPEEFQKMAYAAQSVGIEQDKLADILKDVNDRVGDFMATGGGPMKDFFERVAPLVGVTADQFRKLSGPQALQLYVDSLEKANLNQQDFTFFMEAMASDSTALVPLLRNGGKAAQAYADRLVALGGVMSNDTVASLAAMKTSLADVGTVIRGMGMQLGAAFAPVVSSLAQAFTVLFSKGAPLRGMFDGIVAGIAAVADVVAAVVYVVSGLIDGIGRLVQWLGGAAVEATGLGEALSWAFSISPAGILVRIVDVVKALGGWAGSVRALGAVAGEVFGRIGIAAGALVPAMAAAAEGMRAEMAYALADMAANFTTFATGVAKVMNTIFGTNLSTEAGELFTDLNALGNDAATAASTQAAEAARLMAEATAPLRSLADINAQIAASGEAAAASMNGLGLGIQSATDAANGGGKGGKGGKGLTGLKDELTALQKATEEWRDTMKSAFTDFITKGGSFKDVLSQIIGKLAEMLANSAFDSLWSGLGGGKFFGGILSAFGIGANANGTNNWRGGITQVHERGGEIMNLPRGTQVIPHDISKRMADRAASVSERLQIGITMDPSTGALGAFVDDRAGRRIAEAQPVFVKQAVSATGRAMGSTKKFGGRVV